MAINKIPPQSAQNNAKRGLELREKYNRGGLSVEEARDKGIRSGVESARSISSGEPLSDDLIKAMARFNRFRNDYKPDERESDGGQTAGTIAWLLWGGTTGVDWAIKKSAEIDKQKDNTKKSFTMKKLKVPFEIKEMNNEDPEYFVFEGYASTFGNVDLGNDIIEQGAFTKSLQKRNFKILWQHSMREPIGMPTEAYEDSKGLYIKARLPKEDDFVRGRVIPQMKVGSIDSMSIGFMVEEDSYDRDVRKIKSLELFEVSLVTTPMNPQAMVTGFKAVDPNENLPLAPRDRDWDSAAAIQRIREYTDSLDTPSSTYKEYFMYYDADNAENFSAYKLPFADIINGEPHLIPRAIFAIAAAISGARGGVELPSADKSKITNLINQTYARMAEEFDDDSIRSPLLKELNKDIELKSVNDISCMKDVENILKVKCGFSQNERKVFISKIKGFQKERDVLDEIKELRDAIEGQDLIKTLTNFTNQIKG